MTASFRSFSLKLCLVLLVLSGQPVSAAVHHAAVEGENCEVIRAAYDVGSSGIKLSAKILDRCENKVVKDLFSEVRVSIPFTSQMTGATLEKKKPFELEWWLSVATPKFVEAKGIVKEKVKDFVKRADGTEYDIEHVGIGTHALRVSSNAEELLEKFILPLGIRIEVVTQAREGKLELAGIRRSLENQKRETPSFIVPNENEMASWGIGDGSTQFMADARQTGGKKMIDAYYVSSVAAGTFRALLLEKLGRPATGTVNPISMQGTTQNRGVSDFSKAITLVDEQFKVAPKTENFVDFMAKNHPRVYGVGGIHAGGIKQYLKGLKILKKDENGDYYDYAGLEAALNTFIEKDLDDEGVVRKLRPELFVHADGSELTEEELKAVRLDPAKYGKTLGFAKTQVSSMVLVLETMALLSIDKVYVSNADGTGEIYYMEEFRKAFVKADLAPGESSATDPKAPTAKPASVKSSAPSPKPVPVRPAPVKLNGSGRKAACAAIDWAALYPKSKAISGARTAWGLNRENKGGCQIARSVKSCADLDKEFGVSSETGDYCFKTFDHPSFKGIMSIYFVLDN